MTSFFFRLAVSILCVPFVVGGFAGCSEEPAETLTPSAEESTEKTPSSAPEEKKDVPDKKPPTQKVVTPMPEGWVPNGNWIVDTSALLDHQDVRNASVTDRAQLEQMVDAMTVTFTDKYYVVTMHRPSGPPSRMKTPYTIVERTPSSLLIELTKEDGKLVQGVLELDGEDLTIATADDTRSLKLRRK